MTKTEIIELLKEKVSVDPALDLNLLMAIMQTESSFDPLSTRYEPTFPYSPRTPIIYANKLDIPLEMEITQQKTSWGLFQVMGLSLRELGFEGYLPDQLKPEVNLTWGVKFFRQRCMRRFPKLEDQIAAYNAGTPRLIKGEYSNRGYVDKVLSTYQKYQGSDILT